MTSYKITAKDISKRRDNMEKLNRVHTGSTITSDEDYKPYIHNPLDHTFNSPNSGYCIWEHGMLHYERAKRLYEMRGWHSKGQRYHKKKLCDGTYLHKCELTGEQQDKEVPFYIKYWGTKIITIHPRFRWTLDLSGAYTSIGLRARVNAWVPCNLYSHGWTSFLGSNTRQVTGPVEVDFSDAFRFPDCYHNSRQWSLRNGGNWSSREFVNVFSKLLDKYLFDYFGFWRQKGVTWEEFTTRRTLKGDYLPRYLPLIDSRGVGIASLLQTPKFRHGPVIQALGYLMRRPYLPDLGTNRCYPYPDWLDDCANLFKLEGRRGRWSHHRTNDDCKNLESRIFRSARNAMQSLLEFFAKAVHSDLLDLTEDQMSRRHTRTQPWLVDEQDCGYKEVTEQSNVFDISLYTREDEMSTDRFPRSFLIEILDFLAADGNQFGSDGSSYLDRCCTNAFKSPALRHPPFGRGSLVSDANESSVVDSLESGPYCLLYRLTKDFFMDRIDKFTPLFSNTRVLRDLGSAFTEGTVRNLDNGL